jgi:hypothetical protein
VPKRNRGKGITGVDLVDMTPDYTKTLEENHRLWAERYKAVYGVWPSSMPNGPKGTKDNRTEPDA